MTTAAQLWAEFWQTADAHGCTLAFPPHRRAQLSERWRSLLTPPCAGGLMDIACGRGAVLAHARAAGWAGLRGVDAAPAGALAGADPAILPGVDARTLPFADRAFAVVTSQFGVEYAGLEAAGLEAARVCGSRMILLLHAADGIVVGHAREQVDQARWIDETLDGFAALTAATMSPQAQGALSTILNQVNARRAGARNSAMLDAYADSAQVLPSSGDASAVADFGRQWRDHAARLADMISAAPDREGLAAFAERLAAAGFRCDIIDEGGKEPLIGRWLIAQREDGSG